MLNMTKNTYRIVTLLGAMTVLPAQAVSTLDRNTVLGIDDTSHRTLFYHNIQSLERQIIGELPENKQNLHQKIAVHHKMVSKFGHEYHKLLDIPHIHPAYATQAWFNGTSTGEPIEVVDYPSALSRAEQLGFSWANADNWGEQTWEIFTPEKHHGHNAALLTPLSQLDFDGALYKDALLAPRPNAWSVCRVATADGFVYGQYNGVDPQCTLGDPRTLQWDTKQLTWQYSTTVEGKPVQIPRQHSQFSVLPLADPSTISPHRLAATLIKVTHTAQGFASDFAIDNSQTIWPGQSVGHRLTRMVNTLGTLDFTVQTPSALTVTPEGCTLGLLVPTESRDTPATQHLWYTEANVFHSHVTGRYRCQIIAVDLASWLKEQVGNDVAISDVAFVSAELTYTINSSAAKAISTAQLEQLQASVNALIQQQADIIQVINTRYIETVLYAESWLSSFFPSYTKQNKALAKLHNQDLTSFTVAQLNEYLTRSFPTDEEQWLLPSAWRNLPALARDIANLNTRIATQQLGRLHNALQAYQPSSTEQHTAARQLAVVPNKTYRIHQPLQTLLAIPNDDIRRFPIASDSVIAKPVTAIDATRLRSYAHDKLDETTGRNRWTLVEIDENDQAIGRVQTGSTSIIHFQVDPNKDYRLTRSHDSAEAWVSSHLYLAEGKLKTFIADDQHEEHYIIAFNDDRIPAVMHAQSRTQDGRVYDASLQFRTHYGSFTSTTINESILRNISQPHLSQPRLNLLVADSNNTNTLHLNYTLTDGTANNFQNGSLLPALATRLSTCLESQDQGNNACTHEAPFVYLNPTTDTSTRDNKLHHQYRYTQDIEIPTHQPKQLLVRIPQTDQQGDIRGYHQRWYTFYKPEHQHHLYYDQHITQGEDPLIIRPIFWDMLENSGQPIQVNSTQVTFEGPEGTAELGEALKIYNATEHTTTPLYAKYQQDQGFSPANKFPGPKTPNLLINTGLQAPSFVYSSKDLPLGTYTFHVNHTTKQANPCHQTPEGVQTCMISLQNPWQVTPTINHDITETITVGVQAPETAPYPTTLIADEHTQETNETINIAPGVQWHAKGAIQQPKKVDLPYRFNVWNTELSDQQNNNNQNALAGWQYPEPPYEPTERTALQNALLDMGYQPITQQPTLCQNSSTSNTTKTTCETLPLNDIEQLQNLLAPYHSLQITLDESVLQFDAQEAILAGVLSTATNEAMQWQLISDITDDARIDTTQMIIQDASVFARVDSQSTQILPARGQDWLLSDTTSMLWQQDKLYLDIEGNNYCVTLQPKELQVEAVQSITINTEKATWDLRLQDADTTYCLTLDETEALQQQLHTGAWMQITTANQGVTSTIDITLHSLSDILSKLSNIVEYDQSYVHKIIEYYQPDSLRQFGVELNTETTLQTIVAQFGLNADDVELRVEEATFVTNQSEDQHITEEHKATWNIQDETAHITISQTPTGLNLQGISLQGDYWNGDINVQLAITLNNKTTYFSQTMAVELYPYLDPQVSLKWENYHSQYLAGANTLLASINASLGQTLDMAWVEENLIEKIDRYYNPVLERLYTNLAMAEQVNVLLNNQLPQVDTNQSIVWLRASNFPQIDIHLPAQKWEQVNKEYLVTTVDSTQIDWSQTGVIDETIKILCKKQTNAHDICQEFGNDIEAVLDDLVGENFSQFSTDFKDQLIDLYQGLHTQSLAKQKNLFIGLNPIDVQTLQASVKPNQSPQYPVILYHIRDFTNELARREYLGNRGVFLQKDVWNTYLDGQKAALEYSVAKWQEEGQLIDEKNISSFNVKSNFINCTGDKKKPKCMEGTVFDFLSMSSINTNSHPTDGSKTQSFSMAYDIISKSISREVNPKDINRHGIMFNANMVLNKNLLKEKINALYKRYWDSKVSYFQEKDIKSKFPFAIKEVEINCSDGDSHLEGHYAILSAVEYKEAIKTFRVSFDDIDKNKDCSMWFVPYGDSRRIRWYYKYGKNKLKYDVGHLDIQGIGLGFSISKNDDTTRIDIDIEEILSRSNVALDDILYTEALFTMKTNADRKPDTFEVRYTDINNEFATSKEYKFDKYLELYNGRSVFDKQLFWKEHDMLLYLMNDIKRFVYHIDRKDTNNLSVNDLIGPIRENYGLDGLFASKVTITENPKVNVPVKVNVPLTDYLDKLGHVGIQIHSRFGARPGQFLEKVFDHLKKNLLDSKLIYRWAWAEGIRSLEKQYIGIDAFFSGISNLVGFIYLTDTYIKTESEEKWSGFTGMPIDKITWLVNDKIYVREVAKSIFDRLKKVPLEDVDSKKPPLISIILDMLYDSIELTYHQQLMTNLLNQGFEGEYPSIYMQFDTRQYYYNIINRLDSYIKDPESYEDYSPSLKKLLNIDSVPRSDNYGGDDVIQSLTLSAGNLRHDCSNGFILCINSSELSGKIKGQPTIQNYLYDIYEAKYPTVNGIISSGIQTFHINKPAPFIGVVTINTLGYYGRKVIPWSELVNKYLGKLEDKKDSRYLNLLESKKHNVPISVYIIHDGLSFLTKHPVFLGKIYIK